eukprot:gene6502-11959_t
MDQLATKPGWTGVLFLIHDSNPTSKQGRVYAHSYATKGAGEKIEEAIKDKVFKAMKAFPIGSTTSSASASHLSAAQSDPDDQTSPPISSPALANPDDRTLPSTSSTALTNLDDQTFQANVELSQPVTTLSATNPLMADILETSQTSLKESEPNLQSSLLPTTALTTTVTGRTSLPVSSAPQHPAAASSKRRTGKVVTVGKKSFFVLDT